MVSHIVLSLCHSHFTGKKHQHDPDDDSGMGPSMFTDTKSTTLSEVSYTACTNQIGSKGKSPCLGSQTYNGFENRLQVHSHCHFIFLFSSLGLSGQRAKGSGL